jgi:hypothetical protein
MRGYNVVRLTMLALLLFALAAPAAEAEFAITGFSAQALNEDDSEQTQAGAHPFEALNDAKFSVKTGPFGPYGVDGYLRDAEALLPPGFAGDPTAVPQCSKATFSGYIRRESECPLASQVGVVRVDQLATFLGEFGAFITQIEPVYALKPPPGLAAEFGFVIGFVPVRFTAGIGHDGTQYRLRANFDKTSQAVPTAASTITLWGDPSDPRHDFQRGFDSAGKSCAKANFEAPNSCPGNPVTGVPRVSFLTNPTSCGPQTTKLTASSWENPGAYSSFSYTAPEPTTGCDKLQFGPTLSSGVDGSAASAPTGLAVDLHFPQNEDPDGLATAHLKDVQVTLPEGMAISPSSAGGLGGCSDAQLGLDEAQRLDPVACPEASKIGTIEATTPLLEETLEGGVYLRSQNSNDPESGEMFRLALALESPERGVVIKLPGQVRVSKQTGRITTTFANNPQFPVEDVSLELKSGPRAPLTLPPTCGTKTIEAELTSWGGQSASLRSSFQVLAGCGPQGFAPKLQAGTANPVAGAHSPFTLRVTREDGQQNLAAIDVALPRGLTAKLKGVPFCPEANAATGACPQASQVGTTTVGAGSGASPVYVPEPGKAPTAVYLAGPYKGAPLSLVVAVPAQAGPFDLGTVVVRNALHVDPTTTQVTAKSDPLPQIIQGIPISYRDVRVDVSRPGFTLNPTNCDPMEVDSTLASAQGATANPSSRFQVASCERLGFKPKLAIRLSGKTHRSAYPKLRATLTMPKGNANISRAQVTLPKTQLLEQAHIRTICTRVQYAAKSCPAGSVYGYAKAWSPLLDQPLEGPVYLRSSNNPLPDLAVSLDGQIHVDLVGRIDSVNARIRNTFDLVPDAPVSKFVLSMQGGKKGLLVNNTELCKTKSRVSVKFDAHNGKVSDSSPVAKVDCGKKRRGS